MIARLTLVAALLALPSAAHADDINGWWTISGTAKAATKTSEAPYGDKPAGGFSTLAPPSRNTAPQVSGTSKSGVFACVYNRDGTPTEGSRAYGCSEYPEADALYRSEWPAISAPGTCGFSGQLAVKESKPGAPKGECSMSLIYTCGDTGRHLSVVQACTMTHKGNAITIKGVTAEISEAVPQHAWPTTYSPDTLELVLSTDGKTLSGKIAGKPKSMVKLTKFLDLVE